MINDVRSEIFDLLETKQLNWFKRPLGPFLLLNVGTSGQLRQGFEDQEPLAPSGILLQSSDD